MCRNQLHIELFSIYILYIVSLQIRSRLKKIVLRFIQMIHLFQKYDLTPH